MSGARNRVYRGVKGVLKVQLHNYMQNYQMYQECIHVKHMHSTVHPGRQHLMECLETNSDDVLLTKKGNPYVMLSDAGDPIPRALPNIKELTIEIFGRLSGHLILAIDALATLGFQHGDLTYDNACLKQEDDIWKLTLVDFGLGVGLPSSDDVQYSGVLMCIIANVCELTVLLFSKA